VPAFEQDVLGLDVAMNHAALVRVRERIRHFAGDPQRVAHGQLLLAEQPVAQRLAFDERHHVAQDAVAFARVVQRNDVRMPEARSGGDLAQKPIEADGGGEIGAQHLDGDPASVSDVVGEVDSGHAARAELSLYPVSASKSDGQVRRGITHLELVVVWRSACIAGLEGVRDARWRGAN
jgi:hypothetical protein